MTQEIIEGQVATTAVEERLLVAEKGPSQVLGNLPGDRTRNPSAIQAVVRQRLGAINR